MLTLFDFSLNLDELKKQVTELNNQLRNLLQQLTVAPDDVRDKFSMFVSVCNPVLYHAVFCTGASKREHVVSAVFVAGCEERAG